jgi:hypothetical protein
MDLLPQGLKHLKIKSFKYSGLLDNLPSTLETLELDFYSGTLDNLPNGLIELTIDNFSGSCHLQITHLPQNLQILTVGHINELANYTLELPPSLKTININNVAAAIIAFPLNKLIVEKIENIKKKYSKYKNINIKFRDIDALYNRFTKFYESLK